MINQLKLNSLVKYSDKRVRIDSLTLDNYVSTDNLLPNKLGVVRAGNLPPQSGNTTRYRKGNILIANIRPYLKKIWYADQDGGCSADVLVFDVKDTFHSKFVFYALFRDDFFIHAMKGAKGTKMPRGDKMQILDFLVPEYEYNVQVKIADVLSSLDLKIELNNKINSELENMAKLIYDYWFVQFDFPDSDGKPYKSSGGKMVYDDELKCEIPDGWTLKCLSDLSTRIGDGLHGTPNYVKDSDIFFINGNNLKNGFIYLDRDTKRVDVIEYEKHYIQLDENSILLSINGTLGNLAVFTDEKVVLGKSSAYINCLKGHRAFCYQYMKQNHIQKYFWNVATGSTIKNLSLASLNELKLAYPGADLVSTFSRIMQPLDSKRESIFKENSELISLREWLLPMLMNRQVTIK